MITVADALFLAVLRMPVAVHWSSLDRLMTCFCALFLISAMQTQQLTQLYLSTVYRRSQGLGHGHGVPHVSCDLTVHVATVCSTLYAVREPRSGSLTLRFKMLEKG